MRFSYADVIEATPADIAFILKWLEREYDKDGFGFWCNQMMLIDPRVEPDDFWVIRRNGEAVANRRVAFMNARPPAQTTIP